jgi:23S rRNA pseudouridine1911/1915/1917 synthase
MKRSALPDFGHFLSGKESMIPLFRIPIDRGKTVMASRFRLQWEIGLKDEDKQIKDFLKEEEISRSALTDIKFHGGKILVKNEEVNVRHRLKEGEILTVIFPPENPSSGVIGERIPLEILFEDEYLLVVNKPPGMNTIPSREHPKGSLANGLIGYYEEIGVEATSHIVTRLDRDTSGIVLIAKHRHIHHLLSLQQKRGQIKRTYEALTEGRLQQVEGTIEESIGRKVDSIIEREVRSDGQYACTHYQLLHQYSSFAHVKLQLETGRTHQIRVHMSYIGHPLLGDDLYGGDTTVIQRQALHCRQIQFIHPIHRQGLQFSISLPEDINKILQANP